MCNLRWWVHGVSCVDYLSLKNNIKFIYSNFSSNLWILVAHSVHVFFFRFCFLFLFFLRRGEQTCHSVIQLSPVFTSLIQNSGIASFKVLHLNALAILKCLSERYLEPCQTSMRELFEKQLTVKSHWLFLQKKTSS